MIQLNLFSAGDCYPMDFNEALKESPTIEIQSMFAKHWNKFSDDRYKKILVSISGGADSDRLIDFVERVGYEKDKVIYIFFNTGMEYEATLKHLEFLEKKYNIKINKYRAKTPVPLAVKKYGFPWISKKVSDYIARLQKHGFNWEDQPLEKLLKKYPNCKSALRWWCNDWGENSRLNIKNWKHLKDFLIACPPKISISSKCCIKSKKETAKEAEKEFLPDLCITGVRRAEGGARATSYKNCFDDISFGVSRLRPLFWFKKDDCQKYDEAFSILHSDCYEKYGFCRTGCACCPFGKNWKTEIEIAKKYEPNLYKLAMRVFGPSYDYMEEYYKFRNEKDNALF